MVHAQLAVTLAHWQTQKECAVVPAEGMAVFEVMSKYTIENPVTDPLGRSVK